MAYRIFNKVAMQIETNIEKVVELEELNKGRAKKPMI